MITAASNKRKLFKTLFSSTIFASFFSLNFLFGVPVFAEANASLTNKFDVITFKNYLAEAEKGNVEAQMAVAKCYSRGLGVAPDFNKAVQWCLKAAEGGDVGAQYSTGISYADGRGGLDQDYYAAIKWFEMAAAQGHVDSQHNLGELYSKGVFHDYVKALKWYRSTADQNYPEGFYNVGICYAKGWGVAQDFQEAVKWFQKAVDLGHVRAQTDLCYYKDKKSNNSPERDLFCTFSIHSQDRNINIWCDQDVVSFACNNLSSKGISEYKSVGYCGLQGSLQDKLRKLIQEQDYVEVLKYLRTEDNLDKVLSFLEPYSNEKHPILMLEMSRTLCRKIVEQRSYSVEKLKQAFQWYWLGLLYAELDVACNNDKSTSAAIGMLSDVYHPGKIIPSKELEGFAADKENSAKYLKTLLMGLELTDTYPSPKWVLYHGMQACENKNSLIPQEEWNQARLKRLQELQSDLSKAK